MGKSLEAIFADDPLSRITQAANAARAAKQEEVAPSLEALAHVEKAILSVRENPEKLEQARQHSQKTSDGIAAVAEILGVAPGEYAAYLDLTGLVHAASRNVPELEVFIEIWEELLAASAVTELEQPMPDVGEEPVVVFYSASWCDPCWFAKPAFLELADHFDGTLAYYGHDDVFTHCREVGIELDAIPSFVAFFPDGKRVSFAGSAENTAEFWSKLNGLLSLGHGFGGEAGTLVCEDGVCRIEPGV